MDLTDYSVSVQTPDSNRLIYYDSSAKEARAKGETKLILNSPSIMQYQQLTEHFKKEKQPKFFESQKNQKSSRIQKKDLVYSQIDGRLSNPVRPASTNCPLSKDLKSSTRESEGRFSRCSKQDEDLRKQLLLFKRQLQQKDAVIQGLLKRMNKTTEENMMLQMKLNQTNKRNKKSVQKLSLKENFQSRPNKRTGLESTKNKRLDSNKKRVECSNTGCSFSKKPPKPR